MVLRERDRSRVEPDVDHLGHAAHRAAAGVPLAGEGQVVDVGPVRIVDRLASELLELRERADAVQVSAPIVVAAPDGEGGSPVPLARQRPVDVALQPLAEAPVLDVVGVPADALVGGDQLLADPRRADVPRRLGVVEQRGAAAPAVRVRVLVLARQPERAGRAQVLDQVGIGVLDGPSRVPGDPLVEGAVEPHRVDDGQPGRHAERVVVRAEGQGGVDDAGAVLGGDEVRLEHGVAARAPLLGGDERERRRVVRARQLRPGQRLENLQAHAVGDRRVVAADLGRDDHPVEQVLGDDDDLAARWIGVA